MWKIKFKIRNKIANFLHKKFKIHYWATQYWHCTGKCSDGFIGTLVYRSRLCLICKEKETELISEKSWDFSKIK